MSMDLMGVKRMEFFACPGNRDVVIVADTSVVINLNSCGCGQEILDALPNRVVVTESVLNEIEDGHRKGRPRVSLFDPASAGRSIEVIELGERGKEIFEVLVIGNASETLDDGEAATIGYAVEHDVIAAIDERKASRICGRRYPQLRVSSTLDIFRHPEVGDALGRHRLIEAVVNALNAARMRVPEAHLNWLESLLGPDRMAGCSSIPRSARPNT